MKKKRKDFQLSDVKMGQSAVTQYDGVKSILTRDKDDSLSWTVTENENDTVVLGGRVYDDGTAYLDDSLTAYDFWDVAIDGRIIESFEGVGEIVDLDVRYDEKILDFKTAESQSE